jgi:hypothetical protein
VAEATNEFATPQMKTNRTRAPDRTLNTYDIAPISQITLEGRGPLKNHRPIGAAAEDTIRRMKARSEKKAGSQRDSAYDVGPDV